MKTFILLILFLSANTLFAQTIGITGPTSTITSGSFVTFDITGETANKQVVSVPAVPITTNSNAHFQLAGSKYFDEDSKPGKFKYKVDNNTYSSITVTLTFNLKVLVTSPTGVMTFQYPAVNINVVIAGKVDPPIQNNVISFALGTTPNFFDSFEIVGTTATGGYGTYNYEWECVDNNDVISGFGSSNLSNKPSTTDFSCKFNTDVYPPICSDKQLYIRRKVISGNVVSYSNKLPINNLDPNNGNYNSLVVKIQGNVGKCISKFPYRFELILDEVYASDILVTGAIEINSVVLITGDTPITAFNISNPSSGVRYKWYYFHKGYKMPMKEGIGITSEVYQTYLDQPNARIIISGSDGSMSILSLRVHYSL